MLKNIAQTEETYRNNYNSFRDQFKATNSTKTCKEKYEDLAIEEFARFISISHLIIDYCENTEKQGSKVYEEAEYQLRHIGHILLRSLLDKFFWIFYIFELEDKNDRKNRYMVYLDHFRNQYKKFYNDAGLDPSLKVQLPLPQLIQPIAKCSFNAKIICDKIKNEYGNDYECLYTFFRLMSFDVHGNISAVIFEEVFQQKNLKFLHIETIKMIGFIADIYKDIYNNI